jgi:hypothetical protein
MLMESFKILEYLLPGYVFFTTLFFLWFLIEPNEKITNWICLGGAGGAAYLVNSINNDLKEFATEINVGLFLISLTALILTLYYKRNSLRIKIITIIYSALILIATIVSYNLYKSDIKKIKEEVAKNNEIENYKNKYNFNVDNQFSLLEFSNSDFISEEKLSGKIIIYKKEGEKITFDYELNKKFEEKNLTSFQLNELNYLVLIENKTINVGNYSSNSIASQVQIVISFLNLENKSSIKTITILGGEPPSQIHYKGSPPPVVTGSTPSKETIISKIHDELNN